MERGEGRAPRELRRFLGVGGGQILGSRRRGRQGESESEPVDRNVPDPLDDADDPLPEITEDVSADDRRGQDSSCPLIFLS